MIIYDWILLNREILKIAYTVIIVLICVAIVLKTNRLFRLSLHQGIRYFRNAFLFYGLAFIARYFIGPAYYINENIAVQIQVAKFAFEFLLLMGGFFLLYSLIWKRFEQDKHSFSSLFNVRIFIFYLLAIIIATLGFLWGTYHFMYLFKVITFSFAAGICFSKYASDAATGFFRLYFMVIILNLAMWLANSIMLPAFKFELASGFQWQTIGVISIYGLNIIIFLLFLYGVFSASKR